MESHKSDVHRVDSSNNTGLKNQSTPGSGDNQGGISGQYASIEVGVHKHGGKHGINKVDPREPLSVTKLLPEDRRSEYDSMNNYYSVHHKNKSVSSIQGMMKNIL